MSTFTTKWFISLGLILSSCEAQPVLALDQPMMVGPGAQFCRDFLKEPAQETIPIVFSWVQGYISARNYDIFMQEHKTFDPIPKNFQFKEQLTFVINFCKINPDKDLSDAADAMIERLQAIDALQGASQ